MSYDLYVRAPAGTPMPSASALTAWFAGRLHYAMDETQAIYENDDTGVYFIFDLPSQPGEDDESPPSLALNLNFFRPGCFAVEAAIELDALVKRFSFEVEDPQIAGMDDGPYSTEGLLRGWNAGNELALRTLLTGEHAQETIHTLPAATIQRVWRWNLERKELQARLGEEVFVPRISYLALDGRVQTAVVWGDAIPVVLPPTDQLLLAREHLAPRRFLRRVADVCICPFEEAESLLRKFAAPNDGGAYRRLSYVDPPAEVRDFFRSRRPWRDPIPMITVDQVLEAELVSRARATGA